MTERLHFRIIIITKVYNIIFLKQQLPQFWILSVYYQYFYYDFSILHLTLHLSLCWLNLQALC